MPCVDEPLTLWDLAQVAMEQSVATFALYYMVAVSTSRPQARFFFVAFLISVPVEFWVQATERMTYVKCNMFFTHFMAAAWGIHALWDAAMLTIIHWIVNPLSGKLDWWIALHMSALGLSQHLVLSEIQWTTEYHYFGWHWAFLPVIMYAYFLRMF